MNTKWEKAISKIDVLHARVSINLQFAKSTISVSTIKGKAARYTCAEHLRSMWHYYMIWLLWNQNPRRKAENTAEESFLKKEENLPRSKIFNFHSLLHPDSQCPLLIQFPETVFHMIRIPFPVIAYIYCKKQSLKKSNI